MARHTERERGNIVALGEHDLIKLREQANITEKQIDLLTPYLEELKSIIHQKWEALPVDDGATAKLLKFQLRAVNELQRLMKQKVTHGKQAADKLGV